MTATGFIIMALIVFAVFYAWYRYVNRVRPAQTDSNDRIIVNTDRRRAVKTAQRPLMTETGMIGDLSNDLDSDYNTAADRATNYLSNVDDTGKMYYDGTPSPSFQNLVDDLRTEHQSLHQHTKSLEQLMVEIGTIGNADGPVALPIGQYTSEVGMIGGVDGPAVHPNLELDPDMQNQDRTKASAQSPQSAQSTQSATSSTATPSPELLDANAEHLPPYTTTNDLPQDDGITMDDLPHDDGSTRSTATPSTNMYDAMATEPAKMEPAYDVHGQQYWIGYQMEAGLIGDLQSMTIPQATPSPDASQNQTQTQNAAPVQNAADDCEHPISTLGDVISANPRPSGLGEKRQ